MGGEALLGSLPADCMILSKIAAPATHYSAMFLGQNTREAVYNDPRVEQLRAGTDASTGQVLYDMRYMDISKPGRGKSRSFKFRIKKT